MHKIFWFENLMKRNHQQDLDVDGMMLTLNTPRGVLGVLRGPPLVCYWLTSVEINKHKIFGTNNA